MKGSLRKFLSGTKTQKVELFHMLLERHALMRIEIEEEEQKEEGDAASGKIYEEAPVLTVSKVGAHGGHNAEDCHVPPPGDMISQCATEKWSHDTVIVTPMSCVNRA